MVADIIIPAVTLLAAALGGLAGAAMKVGRVQAILNSHDRRIMSNAEDIKQLDHDKVDHDVCDERHS